VEATVKSHTPVHSIAVGLLIAASARAYEPPMPGSPAALTDWRWLARPPVGQRHVISDAWAKEKLSATEGGYLVLEAVGPGVLDHIWTTRQPARLTIEVDGKPFWSGSLGEADQKGDALGIIPKPLVSGAGGQCHWLAPVGFAHSLRIVCDRPDMERYVSYRTFPAGTPVAVADAAPNSPYVKGLAQAAAMWHRNGFGLHEEVREPNREVRQDFVLPVQGHVTALDLSGSGEVIAVEFHVNPALVGTLREVLVEAYYDGRAEPALRLPITDLVGMPHPWPEGRWDTFNGDVAAGIRYPWYIREPRFYYPEVTFHLNLPVPFARGLRIELVNRSETTRFAGFTRAVIAPLGVSEADAAGRLCGTRTLRPVAASAVPQPLIEVPGPGQLVGLSLFMTGNNRWPKAVRGGTVTVTQDGRTIAGHGLVPLWLHGIYGGPSAGAIWNHPRMEDGFVGCTRHFLTDPLKFEKSAVVGYTPGTEAAGAPKQAAAVALWYRYDTEPYAAPALADRAEPLPQTDYPARRPSRLGPDKKESRVAWWTEAEDLLPMAVAHGVEVRAVEDVEHNYHPSGGRYLLMIAEQAGNHVDCTVRMPQSRYVAVGWNVLWGPNRGTYEIDLLSLAESRSPPQFPQGLDFFAGRALGSVLMKAPISLGQSLGLRRDPGTEFTPPFWNPAPDGRAVLRFICQTKPLDSNTYLLKLDQMRLDMPPPAEPGWHEFEDMPAPATTGRTTARLPKVGRFDWSGWGAIVLRGRPGGKAVFRTEVAVASAAASRLRLRGSLGPDRGGWQVRVAGGRTVTLTPGEKADDVVEWTMPLEGLKLPGPIELEITCTAPGKEAPGQPRAPDAELALDAWAVP